MEKLFAFSTALRKPIPPTLFPHLNEPAAAGRPLGRDLRESIKCLNSNEVEFLVVRALAVLWHAFPRYSADRSLSGRKGSDVLT